MVKLSVIIPVYNAGQYLRDTLDSALRQSFTDADYEIICVDDCSTDNSFEILQEYAQRYAQVTCIRNRENSGVSVTRNNGLKLAHGEYITFLDSDDMIADDVYPRIVDQLQKSGCSIATWFYGCHIGETFHPVISEIIFERCSADSLLGSVNMVWRLMIKKQLIDENDLEFVPNVSYAEDALFCFLLLLKQEENEVLCTNSRLYYYRIVDGSLSKENQSSNKWFEKLSNNTKNLSFWSADYLDANSSRFCKKQIQLLEKRIDEYSARTIYNVVKAKRKDVGCILEELMRKGVYPYRICNVATPVKFGGVLESA